MDRRTVSTSLSADVVEYLLQRDMSLGDIAEILGVTKSFVIWSNALRKMPPTPSSTRALT